jgi:hypothetical protein
MRTPDGPRPACPYQWESALARLLRRLRGEPSRLPARAALEAHRHEAHHAGAFARAPAVNHQAPPGVIQR